MIKESRWYKEGRDAAAEDAELGQVARECPYAERSPKWYLWMEGYAS